MKDTNEPTDRKKDITDAMVEQGLLDNIDLTLTAVDPTKKDLDETYMAVLAYKEFQHALVAKIERGSEY